MIRDSIDDLPTWLALLAFGIGLPGFITSTSGSAPVGVVLGFGLALALCGFVLVLKAVAALWADTAEVILTGRVTDKYFDRRGEVTFSIAAASGNMAEMMYGASNREADNGGGAV